MWIIILILVFIYLMYVLGKRKTNKRDEQEETPESHDTVINERMIELGASENISLKNLSGFNLPDGYLCGIYLFRKKIVFESVNLHSEMSLKRINRIFTETLSDKSFFRTYSPKLPQFSLKIPSAPKLEPEEEIIEEHRLVFEFEGDRKSTEYLVFSFGNDQFQDVKRFVSLCDAYRNNDN